MNWQMNALQPLLNYDYKAKINPLPTIQMAIKAILVKLDQLVVVRNIHNKHT